MISWIEKLCALCAMGALGQMLLPRAQGREGLRMICGLLMLHMTCSSAQELCAQLAACRDLMELFECLMR